MVAPQIVNQIPRERQAVGGAPPLLVENARHRSVVVVSRQVANQVEGALVGAFGLRDGDDLRKRQVEEWTVLALA